MLCAQQGLLTAISPPESPSPYNPAGQRTDPYQELHQSPNDREWGIDVLWPRLQLQTLRRADWSVRFPAAAPLHRLADRARFRRVTTRSRPGRTTCTHRSRVAGMPTQAAR